MLLRYSPTSPFARKARVAAAVLGLPLTLEAADTLDPNDSLRRQNPLGKIPALLTDDDKVLFDSRVILAYFDLLAGGGKLLPADPAARIATLREEALADGMMDAAILLVYESRFRPVEMHVPAWLDHQSGKVARALAAFEATPPVDRGHLTAAEISLACALSWFDFRFEGSWRTEHPRLVAWMDGFLARCPGFDETKPVAVA